MPENKVLEKATIILALYNGERFLVEQLESLRKQTYLDIEVIIADDCSKDNSVRIVQDFIERYALTHSWRIIINNKNKGYSKNFIENCLSASGTIIFFCDQDDIWNENKVELMMNALKEHPEINMLASNLIPFYVEPGARQLEQKFISEMKNDGTVEILGMADNTFHCKRSGCTMSIRKSYIEKIKNIWIENWGHDEFVWKMSCIDNSCGILHAYTTHRRMHINNATNIKVRSRQWRIEQIEQMILQTEALLNYSNSKNINEDAICVIEKHITSLRLRHKMLKKRNPFLWILLRIKYANCYPRKKGLYLDLYLIFFKLHKKFK